MPAGFRETEVTPFPIGEAPPGAVRPRVEAAERFLGPAPTTFEFRANAHTPPVARVGRLESVAEAIRDLPVEVLENAVYGRDLERWIGEAVGDDVLRRELAGIRAVGRHGEALRTILYTTVRGRLDELNAL